MTDPPTQTATTAHRGLLWADRLVAVLAVVLAAWFSLRTPAWGKFDPFVPGWPAALLYLAGAATLVIVLLLLVPRIGRWPGHAVRLATYPLVVLVLSMAVSRHLLAKRVLVLEDPWPPRQELIEANAVDSLSSEERAAWAAALASHVVLDGGKVVLPIAIPADWPYPEDATIAVEVDRSDVYVWARANDGVVACVAIHLVPDRGSPDQRGCGGTDQPPPGLEFGPPLRERVDPVHPIRSDAVRPAWRQYRADAWRTGRVAGPPDSSWRAPGWRTAIDGAIRASASVSGDLVLIGAHGTGAFTALDRATGEVRWVARVPNWIHQDPITDGRIVVVGFGDNLASFHARAPSGVAAYELATGHHLWTAFDPGSVMTSPVLLDAVIVYGTGSGELRKRGFATGALLAAGRLPGFVTMAPPVAVGDTVIFTLDHGTTCALDGATLDPHWCKELGDLMMVGHAAPTVVDDVVLVSGVATIASLGLDEVGLVGRGLGRRLLWSALFPGEYDVHAGQEVAALDLHDGHVRWRSGLFPFARYVDGHTSGTATVANGIAAIVLPVADDLVVFDPEDGEVRWIADAHQARGPPLVVEDRVVVLGRDGTVVVHDLRTGAEHCRARREDGWDRGGATVTGGLAILASMSGVVEAVPVGDLLACRISGASPLDPR